MGAWEDFFENGGITQIDLSSSGAGQPPPDLATLPFGSDYTDMGNYRLDTGGAPADVFLSVGSMAEGSATADIFTGAQSTNDLWKAAMASLNASSAEEKPPVDRLLEAFGKLTPTVRAVLLGEAIRGVGGVLAGIPKGKQFEAQQRLQREALGIMSAKNENARTSAAGVTVPRGLMSAGALS